MNDKPLIDVPELPAGIAVSGEMDEVVVPIRTSPGLPSVFLFHTLSGSTFSYTDLARGLEKGFSVYGVQAAGIDGQRQPYACVEAMARHYASHLRDHPGIFERPVVFAGFSFGGNVALETAVQLRDIGVNVGWVVLLDSHKSPPGWARRKPTDVELFSFFVKDVEAMVGKNIVISSKNLASVGHYQQCILLEKSLGPEFAGLFSPLLRVYKANIRAQARHTAKSYDGRVLYLRATATSVDAMDPGNGLKGKVPNVIVKDIAADHFEMLSEPAVSTVTSIISDILLSQEKSQQHTRI